MLLGEKDVIYNGVKGLFKGSMFAKTTPDKYFVDKCFKDTN